MPKYIQCRSWFLENIGRNIGFLLLGLIGFISPVLALNIPAAPSALTLTVSSATVCAGTSTSLTVSGCPANGAVRWSTAQTGNVIAVAPKQSTTYTAICEVTSTSATSSTATSSTGIVTTTTTATATVQVYSPILLTTETQSPFCNGGNDGVILVNTSGGEGLLHYQLDNQPFKDLNVFGNLKAGTYSVTVKDTKACTAQTAVEVKQPPAIIVSTTIINTKCVGGGDGALIASAIGGVGDYRYAIQGLTEPQTTGTFINLVANTTYTVIVSDKNNCVVYQPATIGQPAPFAIKLTPTPTRCVGTADGSVTVQASGGSGAYKYQLGNGPFQTGTQFTGLAASTYEITVQDAIGCLGKQSTTIGQPAPLTLTAVSKPVGCLNPASGAIMMTSAGGTGAVTYQIVAGTIPQSSSVISGVAVGNYTVIGTDANGCTSLASVTVGKVDPLKAQAAAIPATCCTCPTGAVNLTSTGGTGTGQQYQIIGQAYQAASQISHLPPNTYRLRVQDDGGCADSVVATVTNMNALTLSTGTIKNVSCSGGHDGEATVQIAGGAKPFTVYWQTDHRDTLKTVTASQTSLSEGTYTVSVRDSNRCTTSTVFVSLTALNPTPPKPTVSQVANSTLVVDQTSGIQWYVSTGSTSGSAVSNANGSTLIPFASGQYYVVVTVNGCPSPPSDAINFILTALNEPVAPLSVRVVPNPIIDRLRLEIEQPERSAVQIHLLDASGRAVRSYLIPAFTGKKQAEWPIEGISTGFYLLKVSAESRQSVLRVAVE
ncbi:T9SS type A sorting domain-containing protein [Spirosoma sp. HMF4905]|uniref:T9SS type A sorting domain-containing protein n=1 Tax=Spirosoma arboris TaxID=2682092 RepID=A0A7K1S967_9BACT|nr:T9SS type A sorting domain-containing protein [Spirosoma arboris]MVM30374.1 T9SS type A sorting domain-containing protein [Spirosoma arboris]